MMRDLIERFAYRFQLWSREHDEERFGAGSVRPAVKIYRKDESTFQMVIRYIGVTALSITTFAMIGRMLIRFAPGAALAVFVTLAILIPIWILCGITVFIREFQAKKELASEQLKSSNQALELTATRQENYKGEIRK